MQSPSCLISTLCKPANHSRHPLLLMQLALRNSVETALTLLQDGELEKALNSIDGALRFKPSKHLKISLWNARDEIKRNQVPGAITLLRAILHAAGPKVKGSGGYTLVNNTAVMSVLYYTLRGVMKVKEEGNFRVPSDPGEIQHVIFLQHGNPIALALCTKIEPSMGDWVVTYGNVLWMQNEKP